jgi:hypothetical protein
VLEAIAVLGSVDGLPETLSAHKKAHLAARYRRHSRQAIPFVLPS